MSHKSFLSVIMVTTLDGLTQAVIWFTSIEKILAIGLIVLNILWILYKWCNDIRDRKLKKDNDSQDKKNKRDDEALSHKEKREDEIYHRKHK